MIGMSDDKGGVEAYIKNLCGCLKADKYEVIHRLPEMVIDGKKWLCPFTRHNYLKYWWFWHRFYRENKFDVVYLNACDVVSIDDLRFAKAAGVPVRIIHSHGSEHQMLFSGVMGVIHRITEWCNKKFLDKYATHLFACSDVAGEWMFDGRPYTLIKNGVKLSKYRYDVCIRQAIRTKYMLGGGKIIGLVGRLEDPKNPFFSLNVLEQVFKLDGHAKAVFIGDGSHRQELERLVQQKGLQEKVIFAGAVDNVHEWLSAIDCVLMPSLFEGLPFALVEAQAAGLHCVASTGVSTEANITGLVEFVDLKAPLQVWAEKVLWACQQPRVDVTQQLIAAGYSIEDTAKQVTGIIEQQIAVRE